VCESVSVAYEGEMVKSKKGGGPRLSCRQSTFLVQKSTSKQQQSAFVRCDINLGGVREKKRGNKKQELSYMSPSHGISVREGDDTI
jgi:hypothetical protein